MAIQALTQEPCDDAISREAVNTLVDELARAISDERCHIPQRGRDTGHIMHDILELPSVTVRQTDCENCSKCEDAFMRGHDVGLENGYKQGERDARYESVTQKTDNKYRKYRKEAKRWKNKWLKLKKPKTGHWTEVIDEIDSLGNKTWHHKCSICGNEDSGWGDYKYCPNCGAKMVEPQESEE